MIIRGANDDRLSLGVVRRGKGVVRGATGERGCREGSVVVGGECRIFAA